MTSHNKPVAWLFEGDGWGKEVMFSHQEALDRRERLSRTWNIEITPLYSTPPAAPVQPEYGYMRIVEVFDRNETAGAFLREDGEGGFAAGVSRMADEIDRLRAALSAAPSPVGERDALIERLVKALAQAIDYVDRRVSEAREEAFEMKETPDAAFYVEMVTDSEAVLEACHAALRAALSTPPAAAVTQDELEKARAEQWRLRREAEGSRDAARAAADSLRIERDTLRAAIEPFAKLYSEIPEDNFWPSEEYRNLGIAAEAYALSASPSPVTEEGGGNAVPQTLDEIIENSLRMWYFNYDPSLDHTAARIAMREIIKYVIDVARVSPASPSPVDSRELIERLQQIHDEQRSVLGQMLLDKSEEGQRASNWQGGKVNGIASAIAALSRSTPAQTEPAPYCKFPLCPGNIGAACDKRCDPASAISLPENAEDRKDNE